MRALLWGILWCSLLYGCITDLKSRLVYNFTWWFGGLSAGGLLWGSLAKESAAGKLLRADICRELTVGKALWGSVLWELSVFLILQLIFFCHMYGKADCYAFCVCAMAEASLGMGLKEYLVHMLFAVSFLFYVQLVRHNIAADGNLKTPVAFLPYITVSFACCIGLY